MKYPLAIAISTIAVFALMGLVIATGAMRFHEPSPATYLLKIDSVAIACPEEGSIKKPLLIQSFTDALTKQCNGKPHCSVNTAKLYGKADTTPNCTDKLRIRYFCTPNTEKKRIFLYEGQRGSLHCDQPRH
jgi:hypothetical protein